MRVYSIEKEMKADPGEYLFHEPTQQLVMCGQFNTEENYIQALGEGRIFKDEIKNFKKIQLNSQEHHQRSSTRCKGCRGG